MRKAVETMHDALAIMISPPLEALFDRIEFRQAVRRGRRVAVKRSHSETIRFGSGRQRADGTQIQPSAAKLRAA